MAENILPPKKKHLRLRMFFKIPWNGIASVLRYKKYLALFLVSSIVFFLFYLFIPVSLIPSNTLSFEFSLLSPLDIALMVVLAFLTGLILTLEVFSFFRSRANRMAGTSRGGVGFFASLISGLLASISCGCGLGIILGLVGLGGGTFFVTANRWWIMVIFIIVVLIGLFFSARRANGVCSAFHL